MKIKGCMLFFFIFKFILLGGIDKMCKLILSIDSGKFLTKAIGLNIMTT